MIHPQHVKDFPLLDAKARGPKSQFLQYSKTRNDIAEMQKYPVSLAGPLHVTVSGRYTSMDMPFGSNHLTFSNTFNLTSTA